MKTCGTIATVACVCLLLAGCLVGRFVFGWFGGVYERTASPEAMISSYEWYEQQVRDIQAAAGQIKDAEDALKQFKEDNGPAKEWTFGQREESARLSANLTGLRQARRKMIQDYNARASMITRNLWKHQSLPQHIEE